MKNGLFILLALTLLFFSCKKKEDRTCWKSAGALTERVVTLDSFKALRLGAKMDFVLIQDSTNQLVIKGHENLVNLIDYSFDGDFLVLENKNRCSFLRKMSKNNVVVEIHFTDLINIQYFGGGDLTTEGTLNLSWFTMSITDGGGTVDLNVNASTMFCSISHGYGNYVVRGKTNFLSSYIVSNGYADMQNLEILDSAVVVQRSPVHSYYNFNNAQLRVENDGRGNTYYSGNPAVLAKQELNEGRVIKL